MPLKHLRDKKVLEVAGSEVSTGLGALYPLREAGPGQGVESNCLGRTETWGSLHSVGLVQRWVLEGNTLGSANSRRRPLAVQVLRGAKPWAGSHPPPTQDKTRNRLRVPLGPPRCPRMGKGHGRACSARQCQAGAAGVPRLDENRRNRQRALARSRPAPPEAQGTVSTAWVSGIFRAQALARSLCQAPL